MNSSRHRPPIRGRGSRCNIDHRFTRRTVEPDSDHVAATVAAGDRSPPATRVTPVRARSILSRNASPDVGFNLSVNPYQGCEHGCVYCFARPSHAWLDLSPGLDFETRIMAKINADDLLRKALSAPAYRCEPIAIGVNTDAWQPAERELGITRRLLETCLEYRQPVAVLTKSALMARDLDVMAELAKRDLVSVRISITTLDGELKRRLEPRTAGPKARLGLVRRLSDAGVPVGVMAAPVIPRINDHELEAILASAAAHGATSASYVLLRLPHEVEPLFRDWLEAHYPARANAVMHALQACHGGRSYDARFGSRMRGSGPLADLLARRFDVGRRKHGLDRRTARLDTTAFRRPSSDQLTLFD